MALNDQHVNFAVLLLCKYEVVVPVDCRLPNFLAGMAELNLIVVAIQYQTIGLYVLDCKSRVIVVDDQICRSPGLCPRLYPRPFIASGIGSLHINF